MPKMKKCTICGKNFLSRNGVEVCSAACATERKRRQDAAGNERRRLQLKQAESVQYAVKLLCLCTGNTAVQSAQKSHAAKIQRKTTGNTTSKIGTLLYNA